MGERQRIGLGPRFLAGEHLEGHRRERVDVHAGDGDAPSNCSGAM